MGEDTIFRMKDMETRDAWLNEIHYKSSGASEAAARCNRDKYKSQDQLWEEKVGIRPHFQGNEATERGHRLEPVVRDRFMQKYGWAFELEYHEFGMYYRTDFPMIHATLDGMLIAKSNVTIDFGGGRVYMFRKGERIILEIKNPAPRDREGYDAWKEIPISYRYQAAQQMFCTGVHYHILIANITGDMKVGEVDERFFISMDTDFAQITEEIKVTSPKFCDCVKKKERPVMAVELPSIDNMPSIIILNTKVSVGSLLSNYADVKKSVEDFANQYKGLVVTDENLPQMKDISSMLTKKAKEFNDQRIGVGKQWDEPLVAFKALVDGLIKTINDVNDPIKASIKELTEGEKLHKEQQVKELIEKTIKEEYPNLVKIMNSTGGLAVDSKWLNKTTNWTTIKSEIKSQMDSIQTQWQMLYAFKETVDPHTWSAIFAEYLKSKRNVQSALAVKESLQKAKEIDEAKSTPSDTVEQPQAKETASENETVYTKTVEFSHTDKNEMVALIRYLKEHGFKCREVK